MLLRRDTRGSGAPNLRLAEKMLLFFPLQLSLNLGALTLGPAAGQGPDLREVRRAVAVIAGIFSLRVEPLRLFQEALPAAQLRRVLRNRTAGQIVFLVHVAETDVGPLAAVPV